MNYRHSYHAGNICDVVKHISLLTLIDFMHKKSTPCAIFDSHAGSGLYDLSSTEALKTGEANAGIRRFLRSPAAHEFPSYLAALHKANAGICPENEAIDPTALRFYPGSPFLIAEQLRPGDRLVAAEMHPEAYAELKRHFGKNRTVQCHNRDGYEALCALTPPPEKRGLALIDPPYEQPDEYERIVATLMECHQRWASGVFAIWYGIKDRPAIRRFHEALAATGIGKQLALEFIYRPADIGALHGSGMLIINPPWQFDEEMARIHSRLGAALDCGGRESKIAWLTGA